MAKILRRVSTEPHMQYPQIEEVRSFKTSDDKIFENLQDAKKHQGLLNVEFMVQDEMFPHDGSELEVAEWIVSHWDELKRLMGEDS